MTREEGIKILESLKTVLPVAKDEISEIIKLIESPWISVEDDLPCNHEELMRTRDVCEGTETIEVFATSKSGLIWNDYMIYMNGKWRWNGNYFEPDYWMIAPKLPKE